MYITILDGVKFMHATLFNIAAQTLTIGHSLSPF